MAEKRMLNRTIIESDPFMAMPAEAQMLYVHLNLAADDDGFVSNPRTVMRMCGASDDSMRLLIAKKFVLSFQKGDDFIYLIKHWKIHNTIQKDRYKASNFRELLREVYLDENKAYSMNAGEGKRAALPSNSESDCIQPDSISVPTGFLDVSEPDTDCIQDVSEPETQIRLDKNSKEEISIDQDSQGEGDYKGENPLPPGAGLLDRRKRIDFLIGRIDFFKQMNFDPHCWYTFAKQDGISTLELDQRRKQMTTTKGDLS